MSFAFYWVELEGQRGTCSGTSPEDAMARASEKTGKPAKRARTIEYPASPLIWLHLEMPAFCWMPEECAGANRCAAPRSCVE